MWNKGEELNQSETIIGPSVHLEGNFNSQGNIKIAGSLAGSLQTVGNVVIEEGAKVHASVGAQMALVAGEVRGDVKIKDKLELTSTARVWGNVEAKVLVIAAGAILNGKCNMKHGLKGEEMVKESITEAKDLK
ncbi:polymer-forming cytoskeletal protein [Candidatus Peregrinibacteria bacterium]|nr:polymer-forming cytoskeletal protein [Candidatus Peregrinibacteria bacterium]